MPPEKPLRRRSHTDLTTRERMGGDVMSTDLAGRITGLAAQIEERLTEDETTAKARPKSPASWFQPGPGVGEWTLRNNRAIVESPAGSHRLRRRLPHPSNRVPTFARNDPARVLRRVAVTRELVAAILAEPHDWNPATSSTPAPRP